MINDENSNSFEIRCPKCYYYIALEQNPTNNNLIINCENCGKYEMELNQYYSIIRNNTTKTCNCCCKTSDISAMLFSKTNNYFICTKCFQEQKNKNDFIFISELGRKCLKHKSSLNNFFCTNCNKHICKFCLNEHSNHDIKDIIKENKLNKEIDEAIALCKKEEEELENEKKMYEKILDKINKKFTKIIENRKNILKLKKIVFDSFVSNFHNYTSYKNSEIISNFDKNVLNLDEGIDIDYLNEIINKIDISKNVNPENKIYISNSDSKKNVQKKEADFPRFSLSKLNIEKKGTESIRKEKKPQNYTIYNRNSSSSKKQLFKMENEKINKAILTKGAEKYISDALQNVKNDKIQNPKIQTILKIPNSIINILYIGNNQLLISYYSQKDNLILAEIKDINNGEHIISLEQKTTFNIFNEEINYMELCYDNDIIACSSEKLIKFKIKNNSINFVYVTSFKDNSVIKCLSLSKNIIVVLCENNIINNFHKTDELQYQKTLIEKMAGIPINYIEKLPKNMIILKGDKVDNYNKRSSCLKFMKVSKCELAPYLEKEIYINENEKIFINAIFEKYVLISSTSKGFLIFNYKDKINIPSHASDNLICLNIFPIDENNVYLYTIENKKVEEGENGTYLKKYLIKKIEEENNTKIDMTMKDCISFGGPKIINDIVIVNINEAKEDKYLVLLGDNEGNILYNFC